VFWLGYLVHTYEFLTISTAIVLAILLAAKPVLHNFIRETVSETEFYDTLKFLAVVFVALPLLPNREVGPFGFLNPTHIWLLVVLVSTISYSGYILMRWLGNERGLEISSLASGLVSTTAVTLSLAERTHRTPSSSRLCGAVGVMANAVQFPRLLLLVWVVDRNVGFFLTLPLTVMGVVGLLGSWVLTQGARADREKPEMDLVLQNPYSLISALKFGAFFVGILLLVKISALWQGTHGIYLASALAGIGDASAISLSVAKLFSKGELSLSATAVAILIAVTVNAFVKWILALVNGTREFAFWLGGGLISMLATGLVLVYLCHIFL